ncbi:MAG: hypothetical protein K2K73_03065, partial [Ureaplasma sp.]|nr:hypothetical protein [Ureaplasma sp.]
MFSKVKIYLPFNFYDVNFKYWKKRNLSEIEAIILLNIYLNNKEDPSSLLIEMLLKKLNLDPNKWTEFIIKILKKLNNKEVFFNESISLNFLMNSDVKIDKNIIYSIEKDEYYGLEKSDITKNEKIYLNLFNNKEIKIEKTDLKCKKINELILLTRMISNENEYIKDKLDEIGEKIYDTNYVYNEYFLNNQVDVQNNNNCVFLEKDYEIDIDFI